METTHTQDIKNAAATVIGANALIQTYINTILGTPDINLSSITFSDANKHVVADLPAHQLTARTHAESYFSGATSINAQVEITLSDIIGFAVYFKSRYDSLLALAGPDGNPQGPDLTKFNEGLQGLINDITKKENNCATIVNALADFTKLIQADERNFQAVENIIKATLDGDNGDIKQLQDAIGAINSALNKDNGMIAGGALMELGGILMIVVGVVCEIETFGVATALVVGGLAVTGGGIALQVVAGKDISAKLTELRDRTVQLSTDLRIAACLINASRNVSAIVNSIENAIIAIQNLQAGWSGLKGDLQQITDALNAGKGDEGTTWLITDLNAAYADWEIAKDLAVKLQSNGRLEVQHSNPVNYPTPA
jgi:hypothetical protein